MKTFDSLDALEAALGQAIGPGDWLTVDQDRINAFADATGDHQWIHVDPERAASGPYGATIAHGYLTQSLLPLLAGRLYTIDTGSARVNYGSNKVRFPAPVRAGSRIRATTTPVALERAAAGAFLTSAVTIEIEGADKPACVAEVVTLIVG
ncbi:MaoC family dehydratase [Rhodococcus sp. NPDC054953]